MQNGLCPLHYALGAGREGRSEPPNYASQEEVVKLLLDKKAKVDQGIKVSLSAN
jgi:hypothetical protein